VISIAVLVGFCLSALPHFSLVYALEVPVKPGGSAWLPSRLSGIALAIPFAIWFLCFIEQVTLAVEETEEPARTLPKGIIYGIATLIALAFPVLFLNSGIPPGAQTVGSSNDPLLLGFQGIFGAGVVNVAVIVALLLSGQVATFHSVTYAYGRTIFSLARAGYLPRLLSRTHRTRKTPNYALVAGALIGYGAAVLARFGPATYKLDAVLLNMSVFAAVISYVIQMTSFLLLRRNYPELERPYRSPFGSTGAMTALVISLACLVLLFFNPTYRLGLMGCAVLFVLGALYFAIFRRNRLVLSPEEGFAVAAETARGAKRQAAAPSTAPAVAQFQSRDSRA
jgi:ethanolamine permease